MLDREKVLSGLEHCRRGPIGCQQECPYTSDFGCRSQLAADALELLKEQELVKVEKEYSKGNLSWWYVCGCCHAPINLNDKYCNECGRKVEWDEGTGH